MPLCLYILYVGHQDRFLDKYVLYQWWSLVLETFYLESEGKFCGF